MEKEIETLIEDHQETRSKKYLEKCIQSFSRSEDDNDLKTKPIS